MGIVVEEGVALAGRGDDLHAPLDAVILCERVGALAERYAEVPAGRDRVERVVHREQRRDTDVHMRPLRLGLGVEVDAAGVEGDILRHEIGLAPDAVGEQARAGRILQQPLMPRVVGVVD